MWPTKPRRWTRRKKKLWHGQIRPPRSRARPHQTSTEHPCRLPSHRLLPRRKTWSSHKWRGKGQLTTVWGRRRRLEMMVWGGGGGRKAKALAGWRNFSVQTSFMWIDAILCLGRTTQVYRGWGGGSFSDPIKKTGSHEFTGSDLHQFSDKKWKLAVYLRFRRVYVIC
jgi:hypothetical protein